MAKPRKTLGDWQTPYIQSLIKLVSTQSKNTIANWCISYAEEHILGIFEETFPDDDRPGKALAAAREWLDGKIKLPAVKKLILEAHASAREAEAHPAAQAAARACGQAASVVHAPAHSLGLVFYGTAAVAYYRIGVGQKPKLYEEIAAGECAKMEAALRAIAVDDEPNPAKITDPYLIPGEYYQSSGYCRI